MSAGGRPRATPEGYRGVRSLSYCALSPKGAVIAGPSSDLVRHHRGRKPAGTRRAVPASPPLPPLIVCRAVLNPVPANTADEMIMLMAPEAWFPERPIIPAGLLAMTLGSSDDAAAPANALPRAAVRAYLERRSPTPPDRGEADPGYPSCCKPLDPMFTASSRNCTAD
jgi:hypothetical protein